MNIQTWQCNCRPGRNHHSHGVKECRRCGVRRCTAGKIREDGEETPKKARKKPQPTAIGKCDYAQDRAARGETIYQSTLKRREK